jgi:hypothetical protein
MIGPLKSGSARFLTLLFALVVAMALLAGA